MTISELGYQLYKIDWMRRITSDMQMDTLKNYYQDTEEDYKEEYSFEDYVFDNGYANGSIYVCEDEFLNAEYLDENYMKSLYDNDELFAKYQKDLQENFYND